MNVAQITFEVPAALLHTLNQNRDEFTAQTRLWMAIQLLQNKKLSLGQAIELAGISRQQFLHELDYRKAPLINYDPDELEDELRRFDP
ncbi:MAG: UPF0175 family protein [Chloroflexi bacterium]|nr:UPF0175 family protein [Chloroflexota bacterium]